jgi:NAD(P)-dependent dehydrogenase (short-subunit alcohol dehydrogenase family)
LAHRFGAPHRFDAVDVSDAGAVNRWATELLRTHGAPDLLINNAAIAPATAPLWDVSPADVEAALQVNIGGTVNTIRSFVPAMNRARRGVIVNFSSGWGRSTSPEVAVYCATKFAVEGLTQALAQELPKGLAAVALNPGVIDTDMLRICFGAGASNYPDATKWVQRAGPYILQLGPRDNGESVSVPGAALD